LNNVGKTHLRPDNGIECAYLAEIVCNKCGWCDPTPEKHYGHCPTCQCDFTKATAQVAVAFTGPHGDLCACHFPAVSKEQVIVLHRYTPEVLARYPQFQRNPWEECGYKKHSSTDYEHTTAILPRKP
jgi:hypothetical protein